MKTCKHKRDGLCKPCEEAKVFYEFKTCKDRCLACNQCGYFYGSGAPETLRGRPVVFTTRPRGENQ